MRLPTVEPQSAGKLIAQDWQRDLPERQQGAMVGRFLVGAVHAQTSHHRLHPGRQIRRLDDRHGAAGRGSYSGEPPHVQVFYQELEGDL